MLIFSDIKNPKVKELLVKSYKSNDEFKSFIDLLQKNKVSKTSIANLENLFHKYALSLSFCQSSSLVCQQPEKGYRTKLFYENKNIFSKLTVCFHSNEKTNPKIWKFEERDFSINYLKKNFSDVSNKTNLDRYHLLQFMKNFLKDSAFRQENIGFYLYGSTLTGKTFLTAIFANQFIVQTSKKVIFIRASKLTNYHKNNNGYGQTFSTFLLKLKEIPFLVIDDFGLENPSVFFRDDFLLPLLFAREDNKLPTFIISSLTTSEAEKNYTFSAKKTEILKAKQVRKFIQVHLKPFKLSLQIT